MGTKHRLKALGATDVGRKRKSNQDFYVVDPSIGLYAVADGMGGYQGGEIASRMALEGLQLQMKSRPDLFNPTAEMALTENMRKEARLFLDRTVQELSYQIFSMAQSKGDNFRMGTTICALVQLHEVAIVVHVGDSRCYLQRGGSVFQLTEDHSLVREHLKMGLITEEEAATSRYRNVITRAVGMADRLQVDIFFVDMLPGDRFMLCSDGLHSYLDNQSLAQFLNRDDEEALPDQLISFANESGGSDNISVALISVGEALNSFQVEDEKTNIDVGMDLLGSNPLFADVGYSDRLKIMPLTSMVKIEAGGFLIHEGDSADHLYIVQQGSLAVYRGEELIAKLGVGDYVGEMGIFDGQPSSASVVALEPTHCMVIERDHLMGLLRQEPIIGYKIQNSLIRVLCKRLRSTSQDLAWTRREYRKNTQELERLTDDGKY